MSFAKEYSIKSLKRTKLIFNYVQIKNEQNIEKPLFSQADKLVRNKGIIFKRSGQSKACLLTVSRIKVIFNLRYVNMLKYREY